MIRRSSATLSTLLGAALTIVFVAGCGSATATPVPTRTAIPAISTSAGPGTSGSAAASGSPGASESAAATCDSSLSGGQHVSVALEDLLPSTIGGVCLEKFSLVLSAYIASPPTGGDKPLYAPWLVKFGKTPDDVNMAVTADLSQPPQINFNIHAIEVPGVAAATLSSSFAEVARAAGWPVTSHPNYLPGKSILEITDPATGHLGYVYASGNVLYIVITDGQDLLNEALYKLP
ncbi:MAG: hypothetical protein ABSC46_07970 [Candidatus Limnocylindrales bacterium]|jgi:hypothetical protein